MFDHHSSTLARHRVLAALLLFGLSSAGSDGVVAREFKCWKGSDGEMQCGEVMPREQRDEPVTAYDGHGRRVAAEAPASEVQPAAGEAGKSEPHPDTPTDADRALLTNFRSVADLKAARDHELVTLDTLIETEHTNVRSLEATLDRLRAQAADLERAGRAVPRDLLDKIDATDRAVDQRRAAVALRNQEKQTRVRDYEAKLERFLRLTGFSDAPPAALKGPTPGASAAAASAPPPGALPSAPAPGAVTPAAERSVPPRTTPP